MRPISKSLAPNSSANVGKIGIMIPKPSKSKNVVKNMTPMAGLRFIARVSAILAVSYEIHKNKNPGYCQGFYVSNISSKLLFQ